ncbi:expressed protein [Phakopsora pachyrhizi]|uniref:Expressed protein n=1 Tax=Phakopsora pachyrhizi TaxID=170000 RepID=A0AAV0AXM6_PHAPC|nr:expressed protein [Phakopsora pachyrhizi]
MSFKKYEPISLISLLCIIRRSTSLFYGLNSISVCIQYCTLRYINMFYQFSSSIITRSINIHQLHLFVIYTLQNAMSSNPTSQNVNIANALA